MRIIGISAFYHDSAAALIKNGQILCAFHEERFTRVKHDSSFPINALSSCLEYENLTIEDIDLIVFYEKPFLKFERLIETYLAFAPRGYKSFMQAIPIWLTQKLFQKKNIINSLGSLGDVKKIKDKILFSEHHLSHAASAFYPSPFDESAILTMDGVGEWATTTIGIGTYNSLKIIKEIRFPHSLGLLYSAFTYYLGFKVNSGEYKVMGLAPYGIPKYHDLILSNIIDIKEDGSFKLNIEYFEYCTGLTMTSKKFHKLFGKEPRKPESTITQFDMDIAASVQSVLEYVVILIANYVYTITGSKNLCLAGGVALNCVANSKILNKSPFKNIWIQPASGDAGCSIGAALAAYYLFKQKPRKVNPLLDGMSGTYLGSSFTDDQIMEVLQKTGAVFDVFSDYNKLIKKTAELIAKGNVIGWFQGRAEFGPRSLGNRSILADPRSATMQKNLNLKIKFRESFRPFAPSVLIEDASKWFKLDVASPYMLIIASVKDIINDSELDKIEGFKKLEYINSPVPAVTHVDHSARIQTVDKKTNKLFYQLIKKFAKISNCPVLVNTSFNIRGEPIVNTPADAFRCFINTDMDYLVIGHYFLEKKKQNKSKLNLQNYINKFELD